MSRCPFLPMLYHTAGTSPRGAPSSLTAAHSAHVALNEPARHLHPSCDPVNPVPDTGPVRFASSVSSGSVACAVPLSLCGGSPLFCCRCCFFSFNASTWLVPAARTRNWSGQGVRNFSESAMRLLCSSLSHTSHLPSLPTTRATRALLSTAFRCSNHRALPPHQSPRHLSSFPVIQLSRHRPLANGHF